MFGELKIVRAYAANSLFRLSDICGRWVSPGCPEIGISGRGGRYRLTYRYDRDTAFTVPLSQTACGTFFNLYGRMQVAYDGERDVLLTDDGEYVRVEDED